MPAEADAELSSAWRRLLAMLEGLSGAPGAAVPLTVLVVLPAAACTAVPPAGPHASYAAALALSPRYGSSSTSTTHLHTS